MSTLVLHHPELIALYHLWVDQCRNETLPASADVNPATLRRWLDNLVVVDTLKPGGLRYSYYGDNLSAAFGTDMVGCSIEHLPEGQRSLLSAEYEHIRSERMPSARQYTAEFGHGLQTWERLSLPFFDPDGEVEKILVAAYRVE
jgi:hypothetical protein